ncbi:MAG: hypothetical protein Q7S20_08070 [Gemmatimonadaceae bacterium]|nr:hypothetical protein [Gemmatimonadaceae bacterium]
MREMGGRVVASFIVKGIGPALGLVAGVVFFFMIWPRPGHEGYLTATERLIGAALGAFFVVLGSVVADFVRRLIGRGRRKS